jgi:DNA-binding NtrC family response regulator
MTERACRVLVVDDEVDFATALATRLSRRGFDTSVANDGAHAAEIARVTPPDVVVLDVRMPQESGVAILRRLKEAHPDMEFILLTGHASVSSGIEGMRLGAFDYLMKPVEIEQLCDRLNAAWARCREHDGGSAEPPKEVLR